MTDQALEPRPHHQPDPWEQRKGESGKAYAAFNEYLLMLWNRSIRRAAEKHAEATRRNPETVEGIWKKWSVKYDWVARSDAYLAHIAERERAESEHERSEFMRQQRRMGGVFTGLAALRVRGGQTENGNVVAPIDLNEADWSDVIQLARTGRDLAALGHGMPTHLIAAKLMMIPPHEHEQMIRRLADLALSLIPEELHERFWHGIADIGEGR